MTDKGSFFWQSYLDFMTSLFAVMLILFLVYYVDNYKKNEKLDERLREVEKKEREIKKLKEQLVAKDALLKLQKEKLDKQMYVMRELKNKASEYFDYDSKYQRFILKRDVQFKTSKYEIPEKDYDYLIEVGKKIEELIKEIREEYFKDQKVIVMVLIEGMASNLPPGLDDFNYELSYKRAYSLVKFWKKRKILNDPDVDLQIAGSGTGGLGRYNMPYDPDNITLERKNQRFIIQLVVKAEDMSIR